MKKYFLSIILSLLITSVSLARSTGCKEGNCENGYGKWVYTDKTTYEGEWVGTKKNGQGVETWPNGYIYKGCLLYTSPSPRDLSTSRMPSSA